MPPQLATLITLGLVAFLFRRDRRFGHGVSGAIWIPTLWLLIITTRSISAWLSEFGLNAGGSSLDEGSLLDAMVFLALISAGLRVLSQRRISVALVVRNNRCLFIFLLYCLLSVTWSDLPVTAFKRWFKMMGHPIMVLVLLTELNPVEAVTRLLKRCAYVVVPVSVLFARYYPELGRGYDQWTGYAFFTGITESKNSLGWDLLILGFFFVWHSQQTFSLPRNKAKRDELVLCAGFGAMICWLFSMANSKTPLVALVVAVGVLLFTGFRWVNKRLIGTYVVGTALVIATLEMALDLSGTILQLLGRDASLTERTPLWAELKLWGDMRPILGAGYQSFWTEERMGKIWEILPAQPSEAHNGYLETYLNLGLLGLGLMLCLLVVTYSKGRRSLLEDPEFGRFRFSFLFAILIYNWTESALHGLHPVFFMFFVIALDYPPPCIASVAPADGTRRGEDDEPASRQGQFEPVQAKCVW